MSDTQIRDLVEAAINVATASLRDQLAAAERERDEWKQRSLSQSQALAGDAEIAALRQENERLEQQCEALAMTNAKRRLNRLRANLFVTAREVFGITQQMDANKAVEEMAEAYKRLQHRLELHDSRAHLQYIQPGDVVFRPTGETRVPKNGEWVGDPSGHMCRAYNWSVSTRPIYTRIDAPAEQPQTDKTEPRESSRVVHVTEALLPAEPPGSGELPYGALAKAAATSGAPAYIKDDPEENPFAEPQAAEGGEEDRPWFTLSSSPGDSGYDLNFMDNENATVAERIAVFSPGAYETAKTCLNLLRGQSPLHAERDRLKAEVNKLIAADDANKSVLKIYAIAEERDRLAAEVEELKKFINRVGEPLGIEDGANRTILEWAAAIASFTAPSVDSEQRDAKGFLIEAINILRQFHFDDNEPIAWPHDTTVEDFLSRASAWANAPSPQAAVAGSEPTMPSCTCGAGLSLPFERDTGRCTACNSREKVEDDICPKCGGELDTGWECNDCGFDARQIAIVESRPAAAVEERTEPFTEREIESLAPSPAPTAETPKLPRWEVFQDHRAKTCYRLELVTQVFETGDKLIGATQAEAEAAAAWISTKEAFESDLKREREWNQVRLDILDSLAKPADEIIRLVGATGYTRAERLASAAAIISSLKASSQGDWEKAVDAYFILDEKGILRINSEGFYQPRACPAYLKDFIRSHVATNAAAEKDHT